MGGFLGVVALMWLLPGVLVPLGWASFTLAIWVGILVGIVVHVIAYDNLEMRMYRAKRDRYQRQHGKWAPGGPVRGHGPWKPAVVAAGLIALVAAGLTFGFFASMGT